MIKTSHKLKEVVILVNEEIKTIRDLLKDLNGMGIKVERDEKFKLLRVSGVEVKKAKQGTCVVNRKDGGKIFPNLYFAKYGVNITQMGNSHYIVPILK